MAGAFEQAWGMSLEKLALLSFVLFTACTPGGSPDAGVDAGPPADPVFPADVAESFTEVRGCRSSIEHELRFIRVFVDELAHEPYTTHDAGFPEGAVVVKVEYADEGCSDVVGYTAMKRLADGGSPDALDWHWQEADGDGVVFADGPLLRCVGCHQRCEGGFEATCTEP